jgi:transposase
MRGTPDRQLSMLISLSTDELIPPGHPIRSVKPVVEAVLAALDPEFEAMYAETGRNSVPPEHLLKANVLMALYSIRSERQFCERLRYDMLFKWFLDLPMDAEPWDHSTFSRNQERLLGQEIAERFLAEVVEQARLRRYIGGDHFSVDGTLLEAWASHKSFKPKKRAPHDAALRSDRRRRRRRRDHNQGGGGGRNAEVNFHGERRSNETHESTTDPEALLARKSNAAPAKLSYTGHLLMDNRKALIVDMELTKATGVAERETALTMLERLPAKARRRTVGADKGYDTRGFVDDCRGLGFTPHVAQNTSRRRSAIDGRTTRHGGHEVSLRIRKRIEEPFGWIKTIGGGRKLRYKGRSRNRAWFLMAGAVFNIIRITALDAAAAG